MRGRLLLLAALASACGGDLRVKEVLAPSTSPFRKVTLDATPGEPIGLAVLPDGSVLHTTRTGSLVWHDADGGEHVAATLDVYTHDEEGLQGVAVDPEYEQNGWVYLYYSPALATPGRKPRGRPLSHRIRPHRGRERARPRDSELQAIAVVPAQHEGAMTRQA